MRTIKLTDVVLDRDIFPREAVDQDAVVRYRDAYDMGETLPPIVVEKGTRRLLDGWHRHAAMTELGLESCKAEEHVVPDGVPPLLYAAGLSSRHGVILSAAAKREVAQRVFGAAELPADMIASQLAVHRTTVERWLAPMLEERKQRAEWDLEVRRGASWLMTACGWTQQATADWFGLSRGTIEGDVQMHMAIKDRLLTDQSYLAAALAVTPADLLAAARELIKACQEEERQRIAAIKAAAKVRDNWHDLETAAASCTQWVRSEARPPEGTPKDRITHIITALEACAALLKKEDK